MSDIIIGIALGAIFTVIVFVMFTTPDAAWHRAAIGHAAAHYDATTGSFTWNDQASVTP